MAKKFKITREATICPHCGGGILDVIEETLSPLAKQAGKARARKFQIGELTKQIATLNAQVSALKTENEALHTLRGRSGSGKPESDRDRAGRAAAAKAGAIASGAAAPAAAGAGGKEEADEAAGEHIKGTSKRSDDIVVTGGQLRFLQRIGSVKALPGMAG